MSAPDRATLERALARARQHRDGMADDLRTLMDAAEAYLATLPEPKDWAVICFHEETAEVCRKGELYSMAVAEKLAANLRAEFPHERYVVVRRPA